MQPHIPRYDSAFVFGNNHLLFCMQVKPDLRPTLSQPHHSPGGGSPNTNNKAEFTETNTKVVLLAPN